MKVLMFHDFADLRGGANRYRLELTSLLRKRGFHVSLFTFNPGESEEDVEVFPFRAEGFVRGRIKHHVFHPRLYVSLHRVIRGEQPDIIHVQGNHHFAHTVYLACSKPLPLIQTAHDIRLVCPRETGIRRNGIVCQWSFGAVCVREGCISARKYLAQLPSKIIIKNLFRRKNWRFISPSRALYENFVHFGLKPEFIPNFVDTSSFDVNTHPSDSTGMLFVGSLYPSKGVARLLRAFKEVRRRVHDVTLDIVGDGPEKQNLMAVAERLGLTTGVVFRGLLNTEDLRRVYEGSRVVVLPSVVKENCPLVVLEAMAAGRPVVASRIGGIPELVQDGVTGILVPHNDVDALRHALTRVLIDREAADQMGNAGRTMVEKRNNPDHHLQRIVDLYETVSDPVARSAVLKVV